MFSHQIFWTCHQTYWKKLQQCYGTIPVYLYVLKDVLFCVRGMGICVGALKYVKLLECRTFNMKIIVLYMENNMYITVSCP